MGVVTIGLVLAVKWCGIMELGMHRSLLLVLIPAYARAGMIFGIYFLEYGRPGGGTGLPFFEKPLSPIVCHRTRSAVGSVRFPWMACAGAQCGICLSNGRDAGLLPKTDRVHHWGHARRHNRNSGSVTVFSVFESVVCLDLNTDLPMLADISWTVVPLAFAVDLVIGDPRKLPHPIRWMGLVIWKAEPWYRKQIKNQFAAGALFAISLISATWGIGAMVLSVLEQISGSAAYLLETVLVYYCIAAKSLAGEATSVRKGLLDGDLSLAKERLKMIVGRDVDNLSEEGVARAAVETVSENFVDGVLAPVFYALIGGAPLALAYKMTNTLDSMVGYKNERYFQFGKAAARIDDVVNFIPARLSPFIVAAITQFLAGSGWQSLKTAVKEGRKHTSPNAGFPEAAFAGALGIQLGGDSFYGGKLVSKPMLGKALTPIGHHHIQRACDLMMLSSMLWILFGTVCRYLIWGG